MINERYLKSEITRFRNLLRNYRSHIITRKYNIHSSKHYKANIVKIIENVDKAIAVLMEGLR